MYSVMSKQRVCKDPYTDVPGEWSLHQHAKFTNKQSALEYAKSVLQEHKGVCAEKVAMGHYTYYEIIVYVCDFEALEIVKFDEFVLKGIVKKRQIINETPQAPSKFKSASLNLDELLLNTVNYNVQNF